MSLASTEELLEVHSTQSSMTATNSSLRDNGGSSSGHGNMEGAVLEDSSGKDLVQGGVKRIEAVAKTWTKWALITAYLGLFLMAFTTSLEGQVIASVSVFATSSFSAHSLISTVYVIQGVVNAVVKPPMAKIADSFGRLEAFTICIVIYVAGYIQEASSRNISTYASAQIFYSAGSTGLQVLQQVFIADTTGLANRALLSSLPDTPFLVTTWIGSIIGQDILRTTGSWRWGYGIWAIILPVAFLPLALSLFLNQRKAQRLGLTPPSPWKGVGIGTGAKSLWFELDVGGILILSAAIALILIPLTLSNTISGGWSNGKIIAMLTVGGVCVFLFPAWESSRRLAPYPLIPLSLLKSRTFCAGCGIGFFYFMVFYLSIQPYFYSYLLVAQHQSIVAAGHITQTFSFTSTVTAVLISIVIKYTKHLKFFVLAGSLIYLMGIGLMIRYRVLGSSVGQIVGSQIVVGIGGGMLNVPAQLAVQASCNHQQVAAATAVYLTIVEIGGAVGSAISGAVWSQNIPAKLVKYLPAANKGDVKRIYDSVSVASSYTGAERAAIDQAYQETMNILLIIAICACVPIILLSLVLKNYRLDEVQSGAAPDEEVSRQENGSGIRRWKKLMSFSRTEAPENAAGIAVGQHVEAAENMSWWRRGIPFLGRVSTEHKVQSKNKEQEVGIGRVPL